MFNALTPSQLTGIDQILTSLSLVEDMGNRVEYQMLRTDDGVLISHYVLFIRDRDGIWRLGFF